MPFESHENSAQAEAALPAVAAGTTQDRIIDRSPISGHVTDVSIIPEAAVTANATNFRTIRLVNKGQDGLGSTVIASLPLSRPGTDNLVAFDEKSVPVSGSNAVAVGDVLVVDETVSGTGLAHSGYRVVVQIEHDA